MKSFDISDLLKKYTPTAQDQAQGQDAAPEAPVDTLPSTPASIIPDTVPALPIEGEGSSDGANTLDAYVADFANFFADKEFIKEVPEGVNKEALTIDAFWDIVDHNVKLREQENFALGREDALSQISSTLTPTALDIVNFQINNPNVTETEVNQYLEFVLYRNQVADLNPEDPYDAEQVVRQFLENMGNFSSEEVNDAVEGYKASNSLTKQALVLKPKLVAKLKEQEASRNRQTQAILEQERLVQEKMLGKVKEVVTKGKLKGIDLSEDERKFLIGVFSTDNIQVPVKGGKQVAMGYVDYLTYVNRYTDQGNMENMMLAMLILGGKEEAIRRHYAEPIKKEETKKFFSDNKIKNQFKSSTAAPAPSPERKQVDNAGKKLVSNLFNK